MLSLTLILPNAYVVVWKIIELVKQSKGWSSVEGTSDVAENVMMGVSEEELYNIPTSDFVHRRGFLNAQLTVYHVAFNTCADLRSIEVIHVIVPLYIFSRKNF